MTSADPRPLSTSTATVRQTTESPWGGGGELVRWDTPGAFTHALTPEPYMTLWSRWTGHDSVKRPDIGAEYTSRTITRKNADVEFVVTGRQFAIRYFNTEATDAMVWIDDRPVASTPFLSEEHTDGASTWIVVTLPRSTTVRVRFAGPTVFTGVEHDRSEPLVVRAAPARFTLGVVADSYHEPSYDVGSSSSSAAPVLRTRTGFRIWNMAQGGSGYLASGASYPGNASTPFGSAERLDDVAAAPIDALLVSGSLNDARPEPDGRQWTVPEHRAAVDAYLTALARLRPDLPVVLVGVEPVSYWTDDAPTDLGIAMTANLRDMARMHANVVGFIDPYTENWLTGTGSTIDHRDDGNQDDYVGFDRVHLNGAGQEFYQGKIVDQLKALPAQVGR